MLVFYAILLNFSFQPLVLLLVLMHEILNIFSFKFLLSLTKITLLTSL